MLRLKTGDVTTPTYGIIGHGVNCQGVMGSGVALAIRNKFPKAYEEYLKFCAPFKGREHDLLGLTQLVEVGRGLYVANMFTQLNYGRDGKAYADLNAIGSAIVKLKEQRRKLIYKDARQAARLDNCEQISFGDDYYMILDNPDEEERNAYFRDKLADLLTEYNGDQFPDDHPDRFYDLPIYLPKIGAGLGGLEWVDVSAEIQDNGDRMPITVYTL